MQNKLTICISTSGRKELLLECLASISSQDFPLDQLQILIPIAEVDGAETVSLCSHFQLPVEWIPTAVSDSSTHRNLGIRNCKGDVLYFLDDDCSLPNPSHLKNLLAYHENHPKAQVIGGRYIDGEQITRWGKAYNLVCNSWQDRHHEKGTGGRENCFVGGNLSLKFNAATKSIFFGRVFDFGGEEADYVRQHLAKGHECLLVNGLNVFHHAQHDMKTFFSRAWLHGRNKYHLNQESVRKVFGDRHYLFGRRSRFSSKGLATLYLGLAQLSYLNESGKRKWQNRKAGTDLSN